MNKQNKVIIIKTLGCKLNFAESSTIEQKLTENGFLVEKEPQIGDIYIINTCAVTSTAEKKCRQQIHHIRNQNAQAKIAIVGCFGALQQAKNQLEKEVDIILGNQDKMQIVEWVKSLDNQEKKAIKTQEQTSFFSSYSLFERTRSFLKIQDGCNYHCSYCTVCIARGNSRSDSLSNVIENAKNIVNHGIKEIVLTGVNVGDYRTKNGEQLLDLLKELIQIEQLFRIRISSIEPNLISEEIIDLTEKSKKIVPHFHIPLQSGNNRILGLMKRRYQRELFAKKIEYIKLKMPHACIAADVIVGFPTETDADFEDTYHFLETLPISMLHVFPFSARPNTIAADLNPQNSVATKNKRAKMLIELSNRKKQAFYEENKGKIYPVLFEHKQENGYMFGLTPNYIKVKTSYNESLINEIVDVQLLEIDNAGIYDIKM